MQPAGRTFVRGVGFVAAPVIGALLVLSIVGSYSPDLSLLLFFLFALLGIIAALVLLVGLVLALRRRQWHRIKLVLGGLTLRAGRAFPPGLAADFVHLPLVIAG